MSGDPGLPPGVTQDDIDGGEQEMIERKIARELAIADEREDEDFDF